MSYHEVLARLLPSSKEFFMHSNCIATMFHHISYHFKFTLDALCIAPDRISINVCILMVAMALTQDSRDSCI